jgi:GR25 family glycosyltransferase involved in LPS biosynthesis
MAFINRVCDKVFVINLEEQSERLAQFDTTMKEQEIKYERFNAIKGSTVLKDERLTDYCNTFCTDGMKGCALSHRSIWEYMINNDLQNVFIFEDDAIIDENFSRDFQHVWNHLPKDYDIVYFGCLFGCSDNSVTNSVFKKVSGIDAEEINEFVQSSNGSVGTHAYMISLEGAKKFINKPINFHIDTQILTWIKTYDYNAYAVNNNMVETSQNSSSLSDSYPTLLNSILKNFHLNNLKNPTTFDWVANENFLKLGPFNINLLIIILIIITFSIPTKYYIFILLWLLTEFFISFDLKNTFRFLILLGIPMGIKILISLLKR